MVVVAVPLPSFLGDDKLKCIKMYGDACYMRVLQERFATTSRIIEYNNSK
jgi:hypothetical protein